MTKIVKIFSLSSCVIAMAIVLLPACACSNHSNFYSEQNRALNQSRKVVLRELFFDEEPLSDALVIINNKIRESGSPMKVVFELENGTLFPLDRKNTKIIDELKVFVSLGYTAIGLQDVVHQIAQQAQVQVVYVGDLIVLNASFRYAPK